jgi:hypothetical protein
VRSYVARAGILAAVAFVAALLVFGLTRRRDHTTSTETSTVNAKPAPGSNWNDVRVGILRVGARETACGVTIKRETYGVAHPSLPCGARIFVAYGNTQVLTEVIDRGPYVPGRELDLTPALARKLGVNGPVDVRWRFAS